MSQSESVLTAAVEIPLELIIPDPENVRKNFKLGDDLKVAKTDVELRTLAASIEARGILVPLVLTPILDPAGSLPGVTRYRIQHGHRRFAAAHLAGLASVPAVLGATHKDAISKVMAQIAENEDRADLAPDELALSVSKMWQLLRAENPKFRKGELAARISKSETWVYRQLVIAEALAEGGVLAKAIRQRRIVDTQAIGRFRKLPSASKSSLFRSAKSTGKPISRSQIEKLLSFVESVKSERLVNASSKEGKKILDRFAGLALPLQERVYSQAVALGRDTRFPLTLALIDSALQGEMVEDVAPVAGVDQTGSPLSATDDYLASQVISVPATSMRPFLRQLIDDPSEVHEVGFRKVVQQVKQGERFVLSLTEFEFRQLCQHLDVPPERMTRDAVTAIRETLRLL